MERHEAVRTLMGYVDTVRVHTRHNEVDDFAFAFEVADVFKALGITAADIDVAKGEKCGAVNPRTGMVCNVMPHSDAKHWTLAPDGQKYDWFVEESA